MNLSKSTSASEPSGTRSGTPRLSVIIPCRNEEHGITATLESLLQQESPDGRPISEWGEILVVNDASTDATGEILAKFQAQHPAVRVVLNETRRGLSGSYNRAIGLARAPILLMCHADCRLRGADYLDRMLRHFDDEKIAGVTGKPSDPDYAKLGFEEKTYLLTHLMDVEPEPSTVREINFAEGRCDGFRKSALIEAGLYDETTRISGEDQLLAARLRGFGYRILQDTSLRYDLSVGSSQNTIGRIIQRGIPLGQGQAFVLIRAGLDSTKHISSSANRSRRRRMRVLQITAVPGVLVLAVALSFVSWSLLLVWIGVVVVLRFLYLLHEGRGRFRFAEVMKMLPVAMACDCTYCFGFYRGIWRTWLNKPV